MSGVYILLTKDEFRVNYSDRYDDFFAGFSDEIANYLPNSAAIRSCFENSRCFSSEKDAFDEARLLVAEQEMEACDGIMLIRNFQSYTFEELINE
jgi:hypothetical protein